MAANSKERSEKEKSRLLKVLVFSFAVLIILAWIFNLQNRWKNIEDLTLVPQDDEFSEIKTNLDAVVEDLSIKLKDDKEALVQKAQEEQDKQEGLSLPNNCPEYINCMPTVGEPARSCAIPPGCEEITQVVW